MLGKLVLETKQKLFNEYYNTQIYISYVSMQLASVLFYSTQNQVFKCKYVNDVNKNVSMYIVFVFPLQHLFR